MWLFFLSCQRGSPEITVTAAYGKREESASTPRENRFNIVHDNGAHFFIVDWKRMDQRAANTSKLNERQFLECLLNAGLPALREAQLRD